MIEDTLGLGQVWLSQSLKIWDSIASRLEGVALIKRGAFRGDFGGVCTFVIGCSHLELAEKCVSEMRTSM